MGVDTILNPVFGPLLALPSIWIIIILSLVITLGMTLIYKFMTDQTKMRALKDEMKALQKKMKELQKEPKKAMAVQKQVMEKNMEYMKHSFKVTLITFIPIILIFAWLNANIAYDPIKPGEEFKVTLFFDKPEARFVTMTEHNGLILLNNETQEILSDIATFEMKAEKEGKFLIIFNYNNRTEDADVIISETKYGAANKVIKNSSLKRININYQKARPLGKDFSIFGWHPGFLSIYLIFSIISSIIFRKVFNVV